MGILNYISNRIDDYTGVSSLSAERRKHVIAYQLQKTLETVPISSSAALLVLLMICGVAVQVPNPWPILSFALAIAIAHLAALRTWRRARYTGYSTERAGSKAIRHAMVSAMMFGFLWGGLGFTLVQQASVDNGFLIGVLLAAGFLVGAFCLIAIGQAVVMFVGVSGLTAALALFSQMNVANSSALVLVLTGYILFVPYLGLRQSRSLIGLVSSESASREDSELVSYLLRGYEDAASEWFWEIDHNGTITRVSDELAEALNFESSEVGGSSFCELIGKKANNSAEIVAILSKTFSNNEPFKDIEVCLEADDESERRWVRLSGKPTYRLDGTPMGFVGVGADITVEKNTQSKMLQMAQRDALTGLYNRSSFTENLEASVRRLERYGTPFTLMFMDLDKFKLVNDLYGHPTGDALLQEVAKRISEVMRSGDTIARLGGDEFAIILENTADPVLAAKLASRVISVVSDPYTVSGETLYVGMSVGIAIAPQHGTRPEQLLRNADLALYRSKEDGRGLFRYFEAQMDFDQRERRMLEQEMRAALEQDEFEILFQPMVGAATGRVVCMEALIRWDHEIRGRLSPVEFIPIAEQSNLIIEVGRWSLFAACKSAVSWPEEISVAVNVSAIHFVRSDIVADVRDALEKSGLPASRLEVEITESLLIEDDVEVVTKLNALKAIGVTLAMDDFGTGYSSLSYLTRFPFDRLKIDKSFLTDINDNRSSRAILYAISTLGENLGINITVEGVETKEQVEFLKTIWCDQLQGFYFARPMPVQDVAPFVLKSFAASNPPDENASEEPEVQAAN